MTENVNLPEEEKQPKKRGRKPGSSSNKNYFGPDEELAFQDYLVAKTQYERDKIFNAKLKYPFTKMIESIIRRYNLFMPYEDFEDTFNDTLSFLATKASNFKPGRGKKAYSYCGTICKNYLINKRQTTIKRDNKFLSYDVVYTDANPDNRIETDEETHSSISKTIISNTIDDIKNVVDEGFWEDGTVISNDEKRVGFAVMELLKNWENIFQISDTQKFNKTSILYFIKENTMLSTKEVKDALKKFRMEYFSAKEDYLRNN